MQQLLLAKELAEILRVPVSCVYHLMSARGLPAVRVGRRIRFDPARVAQWLNAQTEEANAVVSPVEDNEARLNT